MNIFNQQIIHREAVERFTIMSFVGTAVCIHDCTIGELRELNGRVLDRQSKDLWFESQ
jgi:hypothetical protein